MQVSFEDGKLFYKLYSVLLSYANQTLEVVFNEFASIERYTSLPIETRLELRDGLFAQPELIDHFVQENPAKLPADELAIVASWKHAVVGSIYVFRYLPKYTIFLSGKGPEKAYGVLALADPLEDIVGPHLPILTDTVLLPFKGQVIYDGLLASHQLSFGPDFRKTLSESYKRAKEAFGIITVLPEGSQAPTATKKSKKHESIKRRLEKVIDMIPCPIAGCWSLHGAETAYYFDHNCECHVLEVWPVGFDEPVSHSGNGHPPIDDGICYEFAEFEFADLVKEVPLDHFHFSQRRHVFEIGWKEGGQELELRIHIVPEEVDED